MFGTQLDVGLWRWTAEHPEWPGPAEPGASGDWPKDVGCVLYVDDVGGAALIDPLIPAAAESRDAFLAWLDARIGDRSVSVLRTIHWHERDCPLLRERYGARAQPGPGIVAMPFPALSETIFWLPRVGALVPGDTLLGDELGGLRVEPDSWLSDGDTGQRALAELLRPLLKLPVRRVLVCHGEPVLEHGRELLAAAIEEANGSP